MQCIAVDCNVLWSEWLLLISGLCVGWSDDHCLMSWSDSVLTRLARRDTIIDAHSMTTGVVDSSIIDATGRCLWCVLIMCWCWCKAENAWGLDSDGVKSKLRRVANAMTVEDVSQTLAELETSSMFLSHRRLVDWFNNTLKPHLMASYQHYRLQTHVVIITDTRCHRQAELCCTANIAGSYVHWVHFCQHQCCWLVSTMIYRVPTPPGKSHIFSWKF